MLADPYYYREDWDAPCSTKPVPINARASLASLTASGFEYCGLTTDRGLLCWGGDLFPPTVIPGARVSKAWVLSHDVCGLERSQTVACWRLYGGLAPIEPPFGNAIALVDLSSIGSGSCGLTRDEPVIAYCWGTNEVGQLGDGTTTYRTLPVPVSLPRSGR